MSVIIWCARRVVSLSLLLLGCLLYLALRPGPAHAPAGDRTTASTSTSTSTFSSLTRGDGNGNANASKVPVPPESTSQRIFVVYTIVVHALLFTFLMRASWAVWNTTKALRLINSRQPRRSVRLSRPLKSALETTKSISSSGSDFEDSSVEYDADVEPDEDTILHAILLPNYKEDVDTLRETLEVLACHPQAKSTYDVYLAMEQNESGAEAKACGLIAEFARFFRLLNFTMHPKDIPGEAQGKSSNISWAVRQASAMYAEKRSRGNVVVTVMDADSHLAARYFTLLTNLHLAHPTTNDKTVYVPPIVFDRNAHVVPTLVRIADLLWCNAGLSGHYESSAIRPPTSVYSVPLKLVDRVGGWDTGPEAIGEDLHMYIKCFFGLAGNLTTRTILSAVSQSNVHSAERGFRGLIADHRARYKQALRHMWGGLDSGYGVMKAFELWWYGSTTADLIEPVHVTRTTSPRYKDDSSDESERQQSANEAAFDNTLRHTHYTNMAVLFHRLFEAHFLPAHSVIILIVTSIYMFFTPPGDIHPTMQWVFDVTGYMRFSSFLGMICVFFLYDDFHHACVKNREDEMRAVGLADRMQGSFTYRKAPSKYLDYFLFPIAGIIFGSAPAIHAQVAQFWSLNIVYSVSKKPPRKATPFSSE
ncbi:MAG: hypothetical protein M1838_005858, partial [Thelocarpon superellum]